jgi:trehalose 6-phosphate phosphatase
VNASKRASSATKNIDESPLRHLFTPAGELALAEVLRLAPLLAFDFDGTLAPIVARPQDARVSVAVAQQLKQLSGLRPVAIVTGRTVRDVTPRLGFTPHYVIGNHGAEDPWCPPQADHHEALQTLREHLSVHTGLLQNAGVSVEDKGYSMALHYRLARDRSAAQACIEQTLNTLIRSPDSPPLKTFGGKCVVNIVLAQSPDKGDAVHRLVERAGVQAAVFVGDDLNDEAVFEQALPSWLTIRIGREDARSQAHYFLDSHAEVAQFLGRMIRQLQA